MRPADWRTSGATRERSAGAVQPPGAVAGADGSRFVRQAGCRRCSGRPSYLPASAIPRQAGPPVAGSGGCEERRPPHGATAIVRRPPFDFNSPRVSRPSTRWRLARTVRVRWSRSTSLHCRARASPRRSPVRSPSVQSAPSLSPGTNRKNRSASSGVSAFASLGAIRGGSTSAATFRDARPQRTARSKAIWRMVRRYCTVRGESPLSSARFSMAWTC